jgi:hypothetical protein
VHIVRVGRQVGSGQEHWGQQNAKGPCFSFQSCMDTNIKPVQTVSTMGKETVREMFRICTDFAITSPQP